MSEQLMEELENLSPEEKVAKLLEAYKEANQKASQAEEARKKQESDISRGINKLKEEKDYFLLMKDEATKLMKDKNYFVDLLDKDEVLAKAVLDEYFDGMTVEDAMAQVTWDKVVKKTIDSKDIEKKIEEITTKKEVDSIISNFTSKLTEEQKELFNKEFNDIIEWKKLSKENINKYLRLAFKEALPDADLRVEKDAIEMATVPSVRGNKPKTEIQQIRKSNIEYLKKQWII